MRAILAIAATSVALVGCGSLTGSSGSSSGSSSGDDAPADTCETVVTKTGVVEQC